MKSGGGFSLGQSLDLPALDRVDTLAQELALLQDKASDGLPSWAAAMCHCGGSSDRVGGALSFRKGIRGYIRISVRNAAVIRGCLEWIPQAHVFAPQSLDRRVPEIASFWIVFYLVDKPEQDVRIPMVKFA